MRTLNPKLKRFLALFLSLCLGVFSPFGDVTIAYAKKNSGSGSGAGNTTTTTSTSIAPQVLIALTNSQSMDGTTSGAIMTGSGTVSGLAGSSSPTDYPIPSGFTPPFFTNSGGTTAPYTVVLQNGAYVPAYTSGASGTQYDNSPSRLTLAKDAIGSAISQYGSVINFALEDYKVSSPGLYTTWVYYMSPSNSGFKFTNTATPGVVGSGNPYTVANPCYQYTTNTNSQVVNDCTSLDGYYYPGGSGSTANYPYMFIGASSDDPSINDVLYSSGNDPVYINYGGPSPSTPYPPNYSLNDYENGNIWITYNTATPSGNGTTTGPTNAGYVPYNPEVMYAQRGFGYYGNQSYWTGNLVVGFAPSSTNPLSTFSPNLAPETNNTGTGEIKADAVQSPIAGLLTGALNAFGTSSSTNCNKYVILVTDGLPTQDLSGNNWPPLGSAAASGYGVYAAFNSNGSLNASGTNDQALTDTITAINNLTAAGIKTYVIGLGAGIDPTDNPVAAQALTAMAIAGGTKNYFAANNPAQMTAALQSIVQQIYSSSAISSPIQPPSTNGSSYQYTITTDASPIAGHASAYPANSSPGTPAVWDAGSPTLMTATSRAQLLYSDTGWPNGTATSSGTGSGSMVLFNSLSSSTYTPAFALTSPTSCVPNTQTIVGYTLDPANYSYTPSGSSTACNYWTAMGMKSGWELGGVSLQDSALYLAPPGNPNYLGNTSYTTWAQGQQNRTPMLLFTSNDGFLYAVNAQTGALLWGWMPSAFLSQLQNFSGFETMQNFNGGFTTVDAEDANGNWATYVVGTAQNGAVHYALKLGSATSQSPNTAPTGVDWWNYVSGGTAPGEQNVNHPAAQAPAIAIINGTNTVYAYAAYIVNTTSGSTTTSTLYEQNVVTGAVTSANLSFAASGQFYYDSGSSSLYVGDGSGNLWQVAVSGSASSDAGSATQLGSTYGAAATDLINYVGYTEINGVPYAWAADGTSLTAFSVGTGTTGWQPLWAATNTSGYYWTPPTGSGAGSWTASTTVTSLSANSEVSDVPTLVNGSLLVPTYSPPASGACGTNGTPYGDFFNLVDGTFPAGEFTDSQGNPITQDLNLGSGLAYSATVSTSPSSTPPTIQVHWGAQSATVPSGAISASGAVTNQPIAWRQH